MATPQIGPQTGLPPVVRRLLIGAAALALGATLHHVLRARLDAIQELSLRDMLAARAELAMVLRVVGTFIFASTGGLGIAIAASTANARDIRRYLGLVILAASLAGAALIWYAAAILNACRA
jgi:hypothetical protein